MGKVLRFVSAFRLRVKKAAARAGGKVAEDEGGGASKPHKVLTNVFVSYARVSLFLGSKSYSRRIMFV